MLVHIMKRFSFNAFDLVTCKMNIWYFISLSEGNFSHYELGINEQNLHYYLIIYHEIMPLQAGPVNCK